MDIFGILSLIGGLALFLYGMQTMSHSLERLAGGKMGQILRRLTGGVAGALLLGLGVTAVIQSSSAVTVMLVGLVNSGMMELGQAISVIMGSNIGTTVTAWLLSLSGIRGESIILQMLKPEHFAPVIALFGLLLMMIPKSKKKRDAGGVLIGFAVLMFGMTMMTQAASPLADSESFRGILTAFSSPIAGVLAGALFTAVIQSSSASVGVLQALSLSGVMTVGTAVPIIMGQNIGTCVSALLASVGTSRAAKRVAVVHILFNCIGTLIFLILWYAANALFTLPFTDGVLTPVTTAIIHTVFNLLTTLLLLPFRKLLEKLACRLVPDAAQTEHDVLLDERLLSVPSFAVAKAMNATTKMSQVSRKSVSRAIELFSDYQSKTVREIESMEETLDHYEDKLGTYLLKLSRMELSEADSNRVSLMLHTISDFERIGDHAKNLVGTATEMHEKNVGFSHDANLELQRLTEAVQEILSLTDAAFDGADTEGAKRVEPLEQVVDVLIANIKRHHVERLQSGTCSIELGFILNDLITNYERISDHCSNIAAAVIETAQGRFDPHAYLGARKATPDIAFRDQYEADLKRYTERT